MGHPVHVHASIYLQTIDSWIRYHQCTLAYNAYIGMFSEEVQESRNKHNRQYWLLHAWKTSRIGAITDQYHNLQGVQFSTPGFHLIVELATVYWFFQFDNRYVSQDLQFLLLWPWNPEFNQCVPIHEFYWQIESNFYHFESIFYGRLNQSLTRWIVTRKINEFWLLKRFTNVRKVIFEQFEASREF